MKKAILAVIFLICCVSICTAQVDKVSTESSSTPAKEVPSDAWGKFFPDGLVDNSGGSVGIDTLSGKIVGIYFSAHWCPPCRAFSPKLVEFRNANSVDFEIVFVSSDKNEEAQFEYMKEVNMEWPAVKYGSDAANSLKKQFGVTGIPTLVILSPNGETLSEDGRGDVESTPDSCLATWKKKAELAPKK